MEEQAVIQEIDAVRHFYADFIIDDNVAREPQTVSWGRYAPGVFSEGSYLDEYQSLVDARQFSFLKDDGSFFQFYYRWDECGLLKCRAAFYPRPSVIAARELDMSRVADLVTDEDLELVLESLEGPSVLRVAGAHIRLDFDRQVVAHDRCHVQLSSLNGFRIGSRVVLGPLVFFDFVFGAFYLDSYKKLGGRRHYSASLLSALKDNCVAEEVGNSYALGVGNP